MTDTSAPTLTILTTLVAALPEPALVIGPDLRVRAANQAVAELTGSTPIGKELVLVFRHPDVLGVTRDLFANSGHRSFEIEYGASPQHVFQVNATHLRDPMGREAYVLLTFADRTQQREAENMRVDFVANVSHELRSPLATMMGLIETLAGPARDDAVARDNFLTIMADEAQRMARLVDDLLSLSRLEAREHLRPDEPVDVIQLLQDEMSHLAMRVKEREMQIDFIAPDELPEIPGDPEELRQVFTNLLDNALKYGREGSTIEISITEIDRVQGASVPGLEIMVRNEGEGIAPGDLPRITERFYRIDKARSRSLGGTGLGLAIVKHIVAHHRGRLLIASDPGKSTSFTVQLPLRA